MDAAEYYIITLVQENSGQISPKTLEEYFSSEKSSQGRIAMQRLQERGDLRLNDFLKLEYVGKELWPLETDCHCEDCGYFGAAIKEMLCSLSPHYNLYCPVCGSVRIDVSRCPDFRENERTTIAKHAKGITENSKSGK